MIKVGQIYKLPISKSSVIVTNIENKKDKQFDWIYFITEEGLQERLWRKTVEETLELVTEYPTWQEAVNSPEFKGDRINEY